MHCEEQPVTAASVDIMMHPVRFRIVVATAGQQLTPYQIGAALPDVPQASLYRHLKILHNAGILTVVGERPIRGAIEKVYAVDRSAASFDDKDMVQTSADDHSRYFSLFTAALQSQFRRYLEQKEFDLAADGLGYRIVPLNLDDAEFAQLRADFKAILEPLIARTPSPQRRRRMLSIVVIPEAKVAAETESDIDSEID